MGNVPGVKHGYESNTIFDAIDELNQRIGFKATENSDQSWMKLTPEIQSIFQDKLADSIANCAVYTITIPDLRFLNDIPNIIQIMPNARLIFVDRDIWDNAVKIFMYDYTVGLYNYSYRLSSIIDNIRLWRSAMVWWSKAEPKRCLNLRYEDLVADPRSVLASVCSFCDIPFPDIQIDPPFDDRGCAKPYLESMESLLKAEAT